MFNVDRARRNPALRLLVELSILIPGSLLVGFAIGTAQHFVAFGVWGYGFKSDAMGLAAFEGGFIGAAAGLLTGVVTYYAVLRREADSRTVTYTIAGSLIGGCLLGLVFFWPSALLTPFLTMFIAAWLHKNRQRSMPSSQ